MEIEVEAEEETEAFDPNALLVLRNKNNQNIRASLPPPVMSIGELDEFNNV